MDIDKPKRIRRTKAQLQAAAELKTGPVTVKASPVAGDGAFQKPAPARAAQAQRFNRTYADKQLLDHDLYKLEVAALKRNASYNSDAPIWEQAEHAHFFHSIDSRGRPQQFCNKVGGHFHEVTVGQDGVAVCGPAIREVKIKRHGRTITKYEPLSFDDHKHVVNYKFSEKIKPMVPNVEFAKLQSKVLEGQTAAMSSAVPDVVDND